MTFWHYTLAWGCLGRYLSRTNCAGKSLTIAVLLRLNRRCFSGGFHACSITDSTVNRGRLWGARPGNWRLLTRGLSGFNCAWIYRGAFGIVDRGSASLAGAVRTYRGRHALSGRVVHCRLGAVRGGNLSHQPAGGPILLPPTHNPPPPPDIWVFTPHSIRER